MKSRHTGRRTFKEKVVHLDLDFYSALGATKLVKRTAEDSDETLFLALAFSGGISNGPSMTDNHPRPIVDGIVPAILALNNAHAVELSWLDVDRLKLLVRQAFYARVIGSADAFLLALDQSADYDSPNYMWFRRRYTRFVYVDRIVVAPSMRGRGYARLLYTDLFEEAHRAGHHVVVCEVNSNPPNPVSDAFHAAFEFGEVGRATIHEGSKTVRYLARAL